MRCIQGILEAEAATRVIAGVSRWRQRQLLLIAAVLALSLGFPRGAKAMSRHRNMGGWIAEGGSTPQESILSSSPHRMRPDASGSLALRVASRSSEEVLGSERRLFFCPAHSLGRYRRHETHRAQAERSKEQPTTSTQDRTRPGKHSAHAALSKTPPRDLELLRAPTAQDEYEDEEEYYGGGEGEHEQARGIPPIDASVRAVYYGDGQVYSGWVVDHSPDGMVYITFDGY